MRLGRIFSEPWLKPGSSVNKKSLSPLVGQQLTAPIQGPIRGNNNQVQLIMRRSMVTQDQATSPNLRLVLVSPSRNSRSPKIRKYFLKKLFLAVSQYPLGLYNHFLMVN